MTGFTRYLQKNPIRKPGVVVTWGRYNPPSRGHELVFNEAASLANQLEYDLRIFASHSAGDRNNPLSYPVKLEYLKAIFPRYRGYFVEDTAQKFRTIQQIFRQTETEYNNFILIVGEDRVQEFSELLTEKMESTFRSVEVWSAGRRDPDSDDVRGISASDMRLMAEAGDLANFRAALPGGVPKQMAEMLLKDVRRGMSAQTKPRVVLEKPEAREALKAGEIGPGCAVMTPKGPGVVQGAGANFYEVILETEIARFWPKDVRLIG